MKKSFLLAAAALMVVACSKREISPVPTPGGNGPEDNAGLVVFSAGMKTTATTADTKVWTDTATQAHPGKSFFEANDEIGIYAINPGSALTAVPTYPAGYQYLNKKYKAAAGSWDATSSSYISTFSPVTTADEIYYQAGNKPWHYLAYYPTATVASAFTFPATTPVTTSNVATAQWKKTSTDYTFHHQTEVGGGDELNVNGGTLKYPGPIMYAYYNTNSTYDADPVALSFKYANARITLDIRIGTTVGDNTKLKAVTLYATTGLSAGYVFDLLQAGPSGTVANVFTSNTTTGEILDGSGRDGLTNLPDASTKAYRFGFVRHSTEAQLATVTGFLVPSATVEDAKVELFFENAGGGIESYIAYLDQSGTGTSPVSSAGTNYMPSIDPGKTYNYVINVNKYQVTVTGSITDWVEVNNDGTPIPAE